MKRTSRCFPPQSRPLSTKSTCQDHLDANMSGNVMIAIIIITCRPSVIIIIIITCRPSAIRPGPVDINTAGRATWIVAPAEGLFKLFLQFFLLKKLFFFFFQPADPCGKTIEYRKQKQACKHYASRVREV